MDSPRLKVGYDCEGGSEDVAIPVQHDLVP